MRIFKSAVAIALLLFAALLILGESKVIADHLPATWHEHLSAILLVSLSVWSAYLLVRPRSDPTADVQCPRCMTLGGHTLAPEYKRSVNPLAWHIGGFFFSVFYSGSRQRRFRCRECNEFFHSHTTISRGYRILVLLFAAYIANYIWSEISEIWDPQGQIDLSDP